MLIASNLLSPGSCIPRSVGILLYFDSDLLFQYSNSILDGNEQFPALIIRFAIEARSFTEWEQKLFISSNFFCFVHPNLLWNLNFLALFFLFNSICWSWPDLLGRFISVSGCTIWDSVWDFVWYCHQIKHLITNY